MSVHDHRITYGILDLSHLPVFLAEEAALDPRVYERAAELIERDDGAGFVQDMFAADIYDRPVNLNDPKACKFCIVGAVARAATELGVLRFEIMYDDGGVDPFNLVQPVTEALGLKTHSANSWNNQRGRTGAEVAATLRAADVSRIRPRFEHEKAP